MCCRHYQRSRTFSETNLDLWAEGEAKGRAGRHYWVLRLPRWKILWCADYRDAITVPQVR